MSKHFCLAPFTHTYLSPQTERRMCCASREPAQNFKQYIDTDSGDGEYNPLTLEEHWNSEHMKDVRKRMLNDEQLTECQVCDNNPSPYRDYFNHLFKHKKEDVIAATDETGFTTTKPVSWDYRISNLCNFKCRMCGDMLSSSWESEMKKHNLVTVDDPKNNWMLPKVRNDIRVFQETVVAQELATAVEEHRVEEIYWVGGEPLMMEEHWNTMLRIVELGDGDNVYARYNTNLSITKYKGIDLCKDILPNIRDWQICASIDAIEETGEYIRSGLNYMDWRTNFTKLIQAQNKPNQARLDLTMTLPGLIEVEKMFNLSKFWNAQLLTKMTFAFTPDIVMSPMCLPRNILNRIIDSKLEMMSDSSWKQISLVNVLHDMKKQPNFEEQWPDEYKAGIAKGKGTLETLERLRGDKFTMRDILSKDPEVLKWWDSIISMNEEEYANSIIK